MHRLDLRLLRKDKKLTQLELAKLTGYPQGFISQMENGKAGVPAIFVKILMDKLNEPNLSAYIVDEEEIKKRANDAQKFSFRAILQTQTHRQNKDVSFDATLYRLFEMLERRDARIEEKNAEIKELRKQVAELKRSLRSSQ